jgi:phenylpyruvate tautomerase PptA (4-oxalocrotonate tautomerase family)
MPNGVTRLPSRSVFLSENCSTFFPGADSDKKRQIAAELTIAVIRVLVITILSVLHAVVDEM